MNGSLDQLHVYLLCMHIRSKRTKVQISFSIFHTKWPDTSACALTRDAYNLYSVNFLNYRFHTIGKYVQNYRYLLSTDMANIGPIPIIGQSPVILSKMMSLIAILVRYTYNYHFYTMLMQSRS